MTMIQSKRLMQPETPHPLHERIVENVIFASRWLLAPIYVGLAAGLLVLLVKFGQRTIELLTHVLTTDGDNTIVGILALVDLALMGSLVVMVMFQNSTWRATRTSLAGWVTSVSVISSSS